jgi:hypothetical protein
MADFSEVSDQVLVTRTLGAVLSDQMSANDFAVPGFVRWAEPLDTVSAGDQLVLSSQYNRLLSDVLGTDDTIHTWLGSDRVLQATLGGTSDLRAVTVEKKDPGLPVEPPPRSIQLPRPIPVLIEHSVVNPNPPRWRDR